jgi:hypothetical protein
MFPVGFEPAISTSERPQAQALDRAATGIDIKLKYMVNKLHDKMFVICSKLQTFGIAALRNIYPAFW